MLYDDSSDPGGDFGGGVQSKKLATSFDFHLDQLCRGIESTYRGSPRRMRAVAPTRGLYSRGGIGILLLVSTSRRCEEVRYKS